MCRRIGRLLIATILVLACRDALAGDLDDV
jgi:hypothetical protein